MNELDNFFTMEDYYKDEDTYIKDNINLQLKLGGYVYSQPYHETSNESSSSRSSVSDYIAAAAAAQYMTAGPVAQPAELSYQNCYPMMMQPVNYEDPGFLPEPAMTQFTYDEPYEQYQPVAEVPVSPEPMAEPPQTLPKLLTCRFKDVLHEPDSHLCQHCNKTFTSLADLISHYEHYNLFKMLKYKCPVRKCPFHLVGFSKKIHLRKHILTKHYDKKNFKIKTSSANELNMINELIYSCTQCSKNFYRRDSLQRHYKLIHKRGEPPSV